ncbi:MAG: hypothetical protein ABIK09_11635 [Pseudomonadota bacterium]
MKDERERTMDRITDLRDQLETRIMRVNYEIQDLGGLDFYVEGVHDRFLTLSARRVGSEAEIAFWAFIDVCRFDLPPSWTTPSEVDAFVVGEPASSGPGRWSSDPEVSVIQVRGVPHGSCSGDTFFIMARLCEEWTRPGDYGEKSVGIHTVPTSYVQGRLKTCLELLEAGVIDVCMPAHGFGLRDCSEERGVLAEVRRLGLEVLTVPFEYRLRFPDASIVASPERTTWQVIIYAPGAEEKARELERLLSTESVDLPGRWRRVGEILGYSDPYISKRLEELGKAR